MESKPMKLGTSLLVPSVQELAKEPLTTVPPRYVRPDQDPPLVSASVPNLPEIPLIDMLKLLSGDFMDSELDKFHNACKEWGFFQLINHGVSTSLVEKVKLEIQEFFNLPMEEKEKFWQQPGEIEGFGQAFVVSENQKLDWADRFALTTLPDHLRKPHLFPKLPLPFSFKNGPNDMKELFEGGMQSMRMNYYPPCPQPELVIGLNSHSDAAGLTILLQVNNMEGLQIRKDGMWIPVKPLPDAFIINIGDVMEIVTNGIYPSVEHRATVNSVKERLSIATFFFPKLECDIGPAPSLVTPETPPLFRRIGIGDYLRGYMSRELRGKSCVDAIRIQNEDKVTE